MARRIALIFLLILAIGVVVLATRPGQDRSAGRIEGAARAAAGVAAGDEARTDASRGVGAPAERRVLFGDLHVHSTFSIDALVYSLPMFGGEGVHPPADACDFARWCSALDFFSMNDHAEGLTPERWRETIDSVRQCNAPVGATGDPDLVAFMGYEWTQALDDPRSHYGHRNVLFRDLADADLPTRPITSLPDGTMDRAVGMGFVRALDPLMRGLGGFADFLWNTSEMVKVPDCERGVTSPDLPADCRENASTPAELLEKLAQWNLPTLVIPHGLGWGVHAPPGAGLELALAGGNHDPSLERLLEVYSGHGNSEVFRDVPEVDPETGFCAEPSDDYLPCCWRAGEIIRERCGDLAPEACEARVQEARRLAAEAGMEWRRTIPDTGLEDWLDCNQCRDCFKPAFELRKKMTAQYGYALGGFDEPERSEPRRLRWGIIGSSDTHEGRAGNGFKQESRPFMTDGRGYAGRRTEERLRDWVIGEQRDPQRAQAVPEEPRSLRTLFDVERTGSFMYPGGIVAVHAAGRSREAIWDALMRREAYGTSGPRMLLWFDLMNGSDGAVPMGGEAELSEVPIFSVRAVGDFVQKPGCSDSAVRALAPDRLESLCHGVCYHPDDRRHAIVAIEVVRIRPQMHAGEPVAPLVEDPWRRLECDPDPAGCAVRFDDPEFAASGRDTVYYVRALQEATPAINGANLRSQRDVNGDVVRVSPCYGGWRTPDDDDCLAPVHERAWSSPIFVDHAGPS